LPTLQQTLGEQFVNSSEEVAVNTLQVSSPGPSRREWFRYRTGSTIAAEEDAPQMTALVEGERFEALRSL
jgi:hypothetical protein